MTKITNINIFKAATRECLVYVSEQLGKNISDKCSVYQHMNKSFQIF